MFKPPSPHPPHTLYSSFKKTFKATAEGLYTKIYTPPCSAHKILTQPNLTSNEHENTIQSAFTIFGPYDKKEIAQIIRVIFKTLDAKYDRCSIVSITLALLMIDLLLTYQHKGNLIHFDL